MQKGGDLRGFYTKKLPQIIFRGRTGGLREMKFGKRTILSN